MAVRIDPLGMLSSPLTRLNFFDGLFLRAELLRREQDGLRNLVFQSNLADGSGIAFGLDASVDGDDITVGPGLAIDGHGRVVLLNEPAHAELSDLLGAGQPRGKEGASRSGRFEPCVDVPEAPRGGVSGATAYYAVVLRHAESHCGWEEVRGRACEDACDASMERPYIVESARIGLCPLTLRAPLPSSQAVVLGEHHLRSRVASAYFADEWEQGRPLIYAAGLRSTVWCSGAVAVEGMCGGDVPVALVAVRAGAKVFLDPWTVRRERMEPPPRRSWAGRMRMRPWDVYLAQALQFQCQLGELLAGVKDDGTPLPIDPCRDTHDLLGETLTVIDALQRGVREVEQPAPLAMVGGVKGLADLSQRVRDALVVRHASRRILVDGGIVELPPAGWLPIEPQAASPLSQQVADLLGPGLDLRFCAVRADQAAGEFESCQHLERISLLRGLDDPARREPVDILVPDGEVAAATEPLLFEVDLALSPQRVEASRDVARLAEANIRQIPFRGVARAQAGPQGPFALFAAAAGGVATRRAATAASAFVVNAVRGERLRRQPNFGTGGVGDALLNRTATDVRSAAARPREVDRPVTIEPAAEAGAAFVAWVELHLDGNPFTAGRGGGGACSLDLLAYSPARSDSVASLEANGRYTVRRVAPNGRVEVRVSGQATRREGGTVQPVSPFQADFVLDHPSGELTVTGDADLKLKWDGTPIVANLESEVPQAHFAIGARARQSDEADDPGNQYHDRALKAITILEGARGGEFARQATAKLFGAGGGSGSLSTSLDWVLFRRRTRYDCGGQAPPTPVEDGRVELWHVAADGRPHGERVEEELRKGNFGQGWRRVDTVVFEGDGARLKSPATRLRERWIADDVEGGDVVLFGAYAGTGAATQPAAFDRLRNVVQGLRPLAALDRPEDDALITVGPPPNEYVRPGSDGTVFLVSLRTKPRDCASLYQVDSSNADLWKLLNAPRVEAATFDGVEEKGEALRDENGDVQVPDWTAPPNSYVEAVVWDAAGDPDGGRAFAESVLKKAFPNVQFGAPPVRPAQFDDHCRIRIFVRFLPFPG